MRALIATFALMAFVTVSTLPDLAQAQTPAGKQVTKHKKPRKAQLQLPPPEPVAPSLI
jgi:hypothetical protein